MCGEGGEGERGGRGWRVDIIGEIACCTGLQATRANYSGIQRIDSVTATVSAALRATRDVVGDLLSVSVRQFPRCGEPRTQKWQSLLEENVFFYCHLCLSLEEG